MTEDNNKISSFDVAMQKSPFDDMSVTLDTRYVDIGLGYNKQTGSRISATIDLNTLGQTTEDDVRSAKAAYQEELMKLDIERRKIINQKLAAGQDIPTITDDKPLDIKIDPTPQRKPPVFPTVTPVVQSKPEVKEETTQAADPSFMGAKAYDLDE